MATEKTVETPPSTEISTEMPKEKKINVDLTPTSELLIAIQNRQARRVIELVKNPEVWPELPKITVKIITTWPNPHELPQITQAIAQESKKAESSQNLLKLVQDEKQIDKAIELIKKGTYLFGYTADTKESILSFILQWENGQNQLRILKVMIKHLTPEDINKPFRSSDKNLTLLDAFKNVPLSREGQTKIIISLIKAGYRLWEDANFSEPLDLDTLPSLDPQILKAMALHIPPEKKNTWL